MSTKLIPLNIVNGELRINSRVATKSIGVNHRQLVRHVRDNKGYLLEAGFIIYEKGDHGRESMLLNPDHMHILMSCFRNTEKARACKVEFCHTYSNYRDKVLRKDVLRNSDLYEI